MTSEANPWASKKIAVIGAGFLGMKIAGELNQPQSNV